MSTPQKASRKTIALAIETSCGWRVVEGENPGDTIYQCLYDSARQLDRFNRAQLAAHMPALPELIDTLQQAIPSGQALAHAVKANVALWSEKCFAFPNAGLNAFYDGQKMVGVDTNDTTVTTLGRLILFGKINPTCVSLIGSQFKVAENPLPSGQRYALSQATSIFYARIEWLGEHLPGWENRLAAGSAMGLTGQSLAEYALAPLSFDPQSTVTPCPVYTGANNVLQGLEISSGALQGRC